MKLKACLLCALAPLTAVSVLAQLSNSTPHTMTPPPAVAPPPPPVIIAPAAAPAAKPSPAPKPKAKHAKAPSVERAKAPSVVKHSVVLNPPATATVKCEVLDVRGQGSFAGEVITHVKKGETVTVLEEITLSHTSAGEPNQWSRIVMPSNAPVWVDADFIDPATMAVRAKRVNVRGGPGENYSVVARLDKDTVVKEIRKKENWLEIETPANASAFVASEYLDKQGAVAPGPELAAAQPPVAPPAAPAPPPPAEIVNVPAEMAPPAPAKPAETAPSAPLAPAPTAASQADQELAAAHQAAAAPTVAAPAPAPAAQPEPAKEEAPRVVTREGLVHHALNIQAPAGFELHDIKTGDLIEYLQPAPSQKKFKIFVGTRVRITGTEFLDPAWPRTPILHVETVDLMP